MKNIKIQNIQIFVINITLKKTKRKKQGISKSKSNLNLIDCPLYVCNQ